ncbi:MAG: hypothetical protein HRU29_07930 [Rhizobiales bacterium]|nr:hypothetical protein [Hyphomicrobiales bacterium]NRB14315.1 hypothetical protein [Hyphomicrobiales bacterium]
MTKKDDRPLRYNDDGNVHMDFHVATNTTIDFIIERFGMEAMDQIFERVGKDVYANLREHLMNGNSAELVKHWRHFFDRENAEYSIEITDDAIILIVNKCTAYEHVQKTAPKISKFFCDQTIKTNAALAEGTPFTIDTEITAPGSCRQIIRRRT